MATGASPILDRSVFVHTGVVGGVGTIKVDAGKNGCMCLSCCCFFAPDEAPRGFLLTLWSTAVWSLSFRA